MTTPTLTRRAAEALEAATTGRQAREFSGPAQVRSTDLEDGTLGGIAVPYGQAIEFWGIREEFAPGACTVLEDNPPQLFWRHQEPIGALTSWADEEDGWAVRAKVSATTLGRDALTLARDDVVRRFSVGFDPLEWEELHDEDGTVTIRHTKVLVREVSLVPHPAYEGARLTEVRHDPRTTTTTTTTAAKERNMSDATTATQAAAQALDPDALAEVRADLEDLGRLVRSGAAAATAAEPADLFRSYGHYVKALAAGEPEAARAFEGATTGDTIVKDAWVGAILRLMEARQRIARLFRYTQDLPAEGMGVEYGYVQEDTTKVERQTAEGSDLVHGKVKIGTGRADVHTFGGWSSLSRQNIERASVNHLELTFRAMAGAYARGIEMNTRTVLEALITARADATHHTGTALDAMAYEDWIDLLLDLAEHSDDTATTTSGLLVSRDVFRAMAHTDAADKMLKLDAAPDGRAGELRITSSEASLNGLRVVYHPGWRAETKAVAFDSEAVRTQESPGAPWRLQDENVVNLTKAFSVYGYATAYSQVPEGILPIEFGAEG